ncbi:hypothetical protein Q5530_29995 [Saccharothrix sp. BKS2]|uniref:hypothetical protein n=1 Tax=Saccharothrix sp. BKS2 TaxID=3064400 RepID=UPI0039EA2A56
MSEADHVWRVTVAEREHEVEIDHSSMTGKILVSVDGEQVGDGRLWFTRKEIDFQVGGVPARIKVDYAYSGLAAKSSLHLDGRYVEPLR